MKHISIAFIIVSTLFCSCKKDWLTVKSDKKLVTPSTPADLQALLDNTATLNTGSFGLQNLAEVGTDNYFLEPATWQALPSNLYWQKNAYIFARDIFEGGTNILVWSVPYNRVLIANVVLDELPNMTNQADANTLNTLRGNALFIRAHSFYWLAQIYAPPYTAATASTDLGIPLRLTSDFNERSVRSNLQAVYDRILNDLKDAILLLPATSQNKTKASKASCHALMARTYLTMGNYTQALSHADNCLQLYNALMDYTTINSSPTYPVKQYNEEVIYHDMNTTTLFNPSRCRVDTVFYQSFDSRDLRKKVFFKPRTGTRFYSFNGSYDGTFNLFGGLATDEMFLVRAECNARLGDKDKAMADLNTLLNKRWEPAYFTQLVASDAADALQKILIERRKELCFRGIRWIDLRRLNKETAFQITVTHGLGSEKYLLPPNDPKYVYPIPSDIISLTGMPQNIR